MSFDKYHPGINFIYFFFGLMFVVLANHPIYVLIGCLSFFVCSIYICRKNTFWINIGLVALSFLYACIYSGYNHFGVTVLSYNFIGNSITAQSIIYGEMLGLKIITIVMWFMCVTKMFTSDKIIYLLGVVSPKTALMMSILLRNVPRVKERLKKVLVGRYGIGRGMVCINPLKGLENLFKAFSIIITWSLENVVDISNSMKNRGIMLKKRSTYSIYRFENRDRILVVFIFILLTAHIMAMLLNQTKILYNPSIIMSKPTIISLLFYICYLIFLLLPIIVEFYSLSSLQTDTEHI